MEKNTLPIGNIFSYIGENITLDIGKKLPTNNNNLNNNNITAIKEEKNATADFKKLKEKGEERKRIVREQMVELNFKESFIGKILKEYPIKKIEENLDLLMERKNIQNPVGWLIAALKNDFKDEEPAEKSEDDKCRGTMYRALSEEKTIKQGGHNPLCPYKIIKTAGNKVIGNDRRERGNLVNTRSREVALKVIRLIKNNLSLPVYPLSPQEKGP